MIKSILGASRVYMLLAVLAGVITVYMHVNGTPTPLNPAAHPRVGQVCYEGTGERVKPEFQVETAVIKVVYIDGPISYNGQSVVGLSTYTYPDPDTGVNICKLWIPMPDYVLGDDKMDTAGHELLHCLTGAFHE